MSLLITVKIVKTLYFRYLTEVCPRVAKNIETINKCIMGSNHMSKNLMYNVCTQQRTKSAEKPKIIRKLKSFHDSPVAIFSDVTQYCLISWQKLITIYAKLFIKMI